MRNDRFTVSLNLAERCYREVVHFVARDSIVFVRDSTVTIQPANAKSLFETVLEFLGAVAIGFVLGKV